MKQGRTVGSYFLFLIKEGLFRLRKELWGWRGLVMLVIIAVMLLDTFASREEGEVLMFLGLGAIWMVLLFPPRMGKLLYLLPFSKKDRMRYLGTYSMTYLVFYVMVYLILGVIAFLLSGYPYLLWLKYFGFCTLPFLMLYSGVVIDSMSMAVRRTYPTAGWFFSTRGWWQQETDAVSGIREDCYGTIETAEKKQMTEEEKKKSRKQIRFTVITVVCIIVTSVQCYGYWILSLVEKKADWIFFLSGVIAYVCAIVGLFMYWGRISEEMGKTGSAGKEECGCNS